MTEQLGRRAAMVLLGSMLVGVSVGLMAWGPVHLDSAHVYADTRILLGVPNTLNALSSVVILLAAAWGMRATWRMRGGEAVRRVWICFQACAAAGGWLAAWYHLAPSTGLLLFSQMTLSTGFVLMFVSMLAERVDPRFGSPLAVAAAFALVGGMAVLVSVSARVVEQADIRPLLLVEILPLLLIPAGALSLRGYGTKVSDWAALLSLYALAKLFGHSDHAIFAWTGWVSGHTLMHLMLAAMIAWLGHCAGRAASAWSSSPSKATQRSTSLYTAP